MDWRDRVIKLMKDRGFKTRNDLCIKAGISAGSLNMALNGTHELKLSTMGKLADALETTTRWLLYGDDTLTARQIPVLKSNQITAFMMTEQKPEDCRQIQISHDLKITKSAFAWENLQDDMMPAIECRDVLVIDKCNSENMKFHISCYVLVVSGHTEGLVTTDLEHCLKGKDLRFYVSRMTNLSSEYYFQSLNTSCPPKLFTFPTQKSGYEFNLPLGRIIQIIRTYVHE